MTTLLFLRPINIRLKIIQVFMLLTWFGVFSKRNSLFANHSKNTVLESPKNDLKINSIRKISIQNNGNFSNVDSLKPMEIWFEQIHQEALLRGHSYSRLGELCKKHGARLSGSDQTERAILWANSMLKSYEFDSVYQQPVMVPRWERGSNSTLAIYSPLLSMILSKSKLVSVGNKQFGIVDSVDYLRLQEMINQYRFNHSPVAQYECNGYINWLLNSGLTNKKEFKNAIKQRSFPGIISALGGSVSGKVDGKIVCIQSKSQLDSLGKTGFLNGKIVLLNRPFEEDYIQTFKSYGSCVNQRVNGAD